MSREFPDWINPWKAAEGKRVFGGSIGFDRMPRLADLLAESRGEARFTAAFSSDGEGRGIVLLTVEAELPLTCQVSFETYLHRVRSTSRLAVLQDAAEEQRLPEHYEPTLAVEGRLELVQIVEDELLLNMPQVPRKPGLDWTVHESGGDKPAVRSEPRQKPFAGLRAMLTREAKQKSESS